MLPALDLDFQYALPSIFALVVYAFVPWSARLTLTYWRAIQVYERQPIVSRPEDEETKAKAAKADGKIAIIASFIGCTFSLLVILFLATSGYDWTKEMPVVAYIRHAVPKIILVGMVLQIICATLEEQSKPLITVGRHQSETDGHSGHLWFNPMEDASKIQSLWTRCIMRISKAHCAVIFSAMACLSVAIVWIAELINDQGPLYLAIFCGFFVAVHKVHESVGVHAYKSFKYLAAIPYISLVISIVLILLFTLVCGAIGLIGAFITFVMKDLEIGKYWTNPVKGKFDDWTWTPEKDLDFVQAFSILNSYISQLVVVLPCVLVCFAYRYDASRAGLATIDDDEAEEIIKQSPNIVDQFGRRFIPTSAVAVSPSILAKTSFPTFNTGYATILLIQVMGIFIDAGTKWEGRLVYLTDASRIPFIMDNHDMPFAFTVWPFLSYLVVTFAMLLSVYLRKDGSVKSLWNYGEQWIPKSYASETTKTTKTAEDLEKGTSDSDSQEKASLLGEKEENQVVDAA